MAQIGNVRTEFETLNNVAVRILVTALDRLGEQNYQLFNVTPAEAEAVRIQLMDKLSNYESVNIRYRKEYRITV